MPITHNEDQIQAIKSLKMEGIKPEKEIYREKTRLPVTGRNSHYGCP